METKVFEIFIRFFENLRSMYIEAIKTYCQIITVECKSMRLVFSCSILDFSFHLSESTDKSGIIWRECEICCFRHSRESSCVCGWWRGNPGFWGFWIASFLAMTESCYFRSSNTCILDIWTTISLKRKCLIPIKCDIFVTILRKVWIFDSTDSDGFDIFWRELIISCSSFFF